MDCSTPGLPVLHHLPELTQTLVHRVSDAISVSKASVPPESETCTFEIHDSFWKPTYEMKDTVTPSYKT